MAKTLLIWIAQILMDSFTTNATTITWCGSVQCGLPTSMTYAPQTVMPPISTMLSMTKCKIFLKTIY
jgi:hypothetical protein